MASQASPLPPTARLPLRLLAPALILLGALTLLATGSIYTLGAVRAYVGGESLWSKARATAVQHLREFAVSRDPLDYIRFEAALRIPRGDQRAREAMMRPQTDTDQAREGLLSGANQPDDIPRMIQLFSWFGERALFQDAVHAWARGDELIGALRQEAQVLRPLVMHQATPQEIEPVLQRVMQTNERLQAQELRFSHSLNRAARQTESVLMASILGAFVLLSLVLVWWTRQVAQHLDGHARSARDAQRRWELAAEAAQLGLFQFDLVRDIVHLDARAAQMHGLGMQALHIARQDLHARMPPEDDEAVNALVASASRTGEAFRLRYRVRLDNGELRHLDSIGRLDLSAGLAAGRGAGVVRDLSEELAHAEQASQREAAEKVARAQRAFLSRLSHELRTPLNAVLGFAQLLQLDKQHPMSTEQRQQVAWILGAGQQLLHLVEDVMDLSKVESGEISLRLEAVDVDRTIADCLPLIDGAMARAKVRVRHHRTPSALWAQADAKRLQQVLVNLLSNACKYNRSGGEVDIRAALEGEGAMAQVRIDVSDTGPGMSETEVASLFQPFKRLPAATASGVEGTGLGLYIVAQLTARMQGSVSVQSQPGMGSCFTVRLPADAANASASALRT
jgi:signal transduction histidine kinase